MKRQWTLAALLVCPAVLAGPASPTDTLRQCMAANLPQAVRVQTIEVTSWDRAGGQRTLKGRIFAARDRDQQRLMARVDHPRDVAGTAFLVRDAEPTTEMYVFLPSYNRVRRLTGASAGGKLWGTDFSYDEFRHMSNAFADGAIEHVGTAQHEGRDVHVVDLRPVAGKGGEAARVLVDQQTCVPLQVEFGSAGKPRKRLSVPATGLRKAGKGWYAAEVLLHDLVAGTRTRLKILGVSPVEKLSAGYFNPTLFHSAH